MHNESNNETEKREELDYRTHTSRLPRIDVAVIHRKSAEAAWSYVELQVDDRTRCVVPATTMQRNALGVRACSSDEYLRYPL